MAGRHSFAELRSKMSPEAQAAEKTEARRLAVEMSLADVRRAMKLSQEEIAQVLHVQQAAVTKMERRADMYVSTVRRFIEAMGGRLEIVAQFQGQQPVKITNFSDVPSYEEEPQRKRSSVQHGG